SRGGTVSTGGPRPGGSAGRTRPALSGRGRAATAEGRIVGRADSQTGRAALREARGAEGRVRSCRAGGLHRGAGAMTEAGPTPLPLPTQSAILGKLAGKLTRVMGAISTIPKRGRNEFFNYQYATEADVADAVRKALVAEGVVLIPS